MAFAIFMAESTNVLARVHAAECAHVEEENRIAFHVQLVSKLQGTITFRTKSTGQYHFW
jgi:hypothetical protein